MEVKQGDKYITIREDSKGEVTFFDGKILFYTNEVIQQKIKKQQVKKLYETMKKYFEK